MNPSPPTGIYNEVMSFLSVQKVADGEGDGGLDRLAGRVARGGESFEAEDAEVAPAGGEIGIGYFGDAGEGHNFIIDSRGAGWIHSRLFVRLVEAGFGATA